MSHISLEEAWDLVNKLLAEKIPLRAFLVGPVGTFAIPGFVDSFVEGVLTISVSREGPDNGKGWLKVPLGAFPCTAWYGDKREYPEELQFAAETEGDSVLRFDFIGTTLVLFFTM